MNFIIIITYDNSHKVAQDVSSGAVFLFSTTLHFR